MRHYRELGFIIVLISNSKLIPDVFWFSAARHATLIVHRRNYGLDFGAWKDVLPLVMARWPKADEILLVNDSVIGPIHSLEPIVAAMREAGDGFFGMVESHQGGSHLQSWFTLARGRKAIADLAQFLLALQLSRSKWLIIQRGELRLARAMRAAGNRVAAAFRYEKLVDLAMANPAERAYLRAALPLWFFGRNKKEIRAAFLKHPVNPTHHLWRVLAGPARFPFLKTELILRNPGGLPSVSAWRSLVPADSPCPVPLLTDHLVRMGGLPPEQ